MLIEHVEKIEQTLNLDHQLDYLDAKALIDDWKRLNKLLEDMGRMHKQEITVCDPHWPRSARIPTPTATGG